MIHHLPPTDPAFDHLSGHPFLAAAIGGGAQSARPDGDFWAMEGEAGFLMGVGETLYATAPQAAAGEIADFARVVGFARLITDLILPFPQAKPLLAMEYGGMEPAPDPRWMFTSHTGPEGFSAAAFAQLQKSSRALATVEETQRYAVALSHAMRSRHGAAVTLMLEGVLVAGAALLYPHHGAAVLSGVAVLPEHRGQGLGRAVAGSACRLALTQGWEPLLCCNPSLQGMYQASGFAPMLQPLFCYGFSNGEPCQLPPAGGATAALRRPPSAGGAIAALRRKETKT